MLITVLLASAFPQHRRCRDMRFCRDNFQHGTQFVLNGSTARVEDSLFHATVVREDEVPFDLQISQFATGGLRVRIQPVVKENFSRFDCGLDPHIVNQTAATFLTNLTYEAEDSEAVVSGANSESLRVQFTPLIIRYAVSESVILETNLDENMVFESHSKISVDRETFNSFTDTIPNGATAVGLDFHFAGAKTRLSGFSEHSMDLNIRDSHRDDPVRMYHVGSFGEYGSVPFVVGHSPSSRVGVFWMNPSDTFYGVSTTKSGRKVRMLSEGGFIDFVLFQGDRIVQSFVALTGMPMFAPLFALGYHQCKWGYTSQAMIETIVSEFQRHSLPLDAIWLDIDHLQSFAPFLVNRRTYPNISRIFDIMKDRVVVRITDPHIPVYGHPMHGEGKKSHYFVKHGRADYVGQCWPGQSSWPNFLDVKVRRWWASQFRISADMPRNVHIWNDMNEPSVFHAPDGTFGKDFVHTDSKGVRYEDRELHNIYGLLNVAGTFQGMLDRVGGVYRPFILTRSFFAGSQKFAWTWTGDNAARWVDLRWSIANLVASGLNGIPFNGADVGGFFMNVTAELLIRWYQAAAWLYPFFREHADLRAAFREPYLFDRATLQAIRSAIADRYRMLPMWYTAMRIANLTGTPITRPLWLEFPEIESFHDIDSELLVADALLVVPVTAEGDKSVRVVKPPGTWFRFGQNFELLKDVIVPVALDQIPVFIRGGKIVVSFAKIGLSTKETMKNSLVLHVAVGETERASGYLYLDDGETYQYLNGEFISKRFDWDNGVLRATDVDKPAKVPANLVGKRIEQIVVYRRSGTVRKGVDLDLTDNFVWVYRPSWSVVTMVIIIGCIVAGIPIMRVFFLRRKAIAARLGFKGAKHQV
jgi:alpha 1,3-glucosidase